METHTKKPGSVRLTETQYNEMKTLGLPNESAYVKYKLDKAATMLTLVKPSEEVQGLPLPKHDKGMEDQLMIQRLRLENERLSEKLEQQLQHSSQTLNGVQQKVHTLLQEELQKRDFETLKKEHAAQLKTIEKLESTLEKAEKNAQTKQEEIEALVKKIGFVELGKTLLPSAISGLAKQYPKQMKGIVGTLGQLGLAEPEVPKNEEQQLLEIITFLKEMYTPEAFEEVLQLVMEIGERLPKEGNLLKKIHYYMNQIQPKD